MFTFEEAVSLVDKGTNQILYPDNPKELYTPIKYILSLKGKKIRPVLTILSYNLFKDTEVEKIINPALAWEIFHNFTLMHDDLMDNADVRRGKPAVHKAWDANTAILSGDAMLILAYKYIANVPEVFLSRILDLFSTTAMEICEGQQYDMEFEKRFDVSEEEYLHMIRLKTAVLIGASMKTGAILGNADEEDLENAYNFGENIGIAFQIKDDLLDVYGDPVKFGKNIGGDILCNKKTYLFINALNRAEEKDKQELLKWVNMQQFDKEEKINAVTGIYNKIGIKEIAEKKMDYFYQKALDALASIKVRSEKKQVLTNLAEMLMVREF